MLPFVTHQIPLTKAKTENTDDKYCNRTKIAKEGRKTDGAGDGDGDRDRDRDRDRDDRDGERQRHRDKDRDREGKESLLQNQC